MIDKDIKVPEKESPLDSFAWIFNNPPAWLLLPHPAVLLAICILNNDAAHISSGEFA